MPTNLWPYIVYSFLSSRLMSLYFWSDMKPVRQKKKRKKKRPRSLTWRTHLQQYLYRVHLITPAWSGVSVDYLFIFWKTVLIKLIRKYHRHYLFIYLFKSLFQKITSCLVYTMFKSKYIKSKKEKDKKKNQTLLL